MTAKPTRLHLDFKRDWEIPPHIANAYLPSTAHVLLKQHGGTSSRRVVEPGDTVREGMVVGVPNSGDSTYVHSPIPGTVSRIEKIRLPEGGVCESVEITLHGSFERLGKRSQRYVWSSMKRQDILQALREKGVVETSGSGRTVVEALDHPQNSLDVLLLGFDEEPYVQTEAAVMLRRPEAVLEGLSIAATVAGAKHVTVLLENDAHRLNETFLALLEQRGQEGPKVEIRKTASRFPRGLLEIARAGLGEGHGRAALAMYPSTLVAVYEAVVEARPFVERYVTVAGGAIRKPNVLKARIGTPIGDLVEECGGFLEAPERLVLGGPFTGLPARDLDIPVTKTLGAVLALLPQETRKGRERACIRCGRCAEFCPVSLDPEAIWRRLSAGLMDEANKHGLADCIACGLCSYVCPSRIPLSQGFAVYLGPGKATP